MKNMIRFLSLFVALVTLLSACGGEGNNEEPIVNPSGPTNTDNTTQDDTKTDFDVAAGDVDYAGTVSNGCSIRY